MNDYFAHFERFKRSKKLIKDGSQLFYIFPDNKQGEDLPATLENALDNGYLVIMYALNNGKYCLNIANENYSGDFEGLALILFNWAVDEGYSFA